MDNDTGKPLVPDIATEFPPNGWEEWKKAVEDTLKGVPFDKAMFTKTYEGITLQPIYRKEDIADLPHLNALPGQAPFVRGNKAEGYTQNGWIIAQAQTAWNPAVANKIILDELNRGLNCVNLKLDKFTRWATIPPLDAIQPDGVWLNDLEDISILLNGIDLKAVPLFIEAGEASIVILGLINAYYKKNNLDISSLQGFIGFDLFTSLVRDGELPFLEAEKWQTTAQMCSWAAANTPGLRTILLEGSYWGNCGADSVSELAYVISSAHECISALLDKGLALEEILPRFQINLSLGSNLFMELAKVRAARLLWAELTKAYSAPEELQKVWIHGVTSSFNKTIYDPYVNILRTATESFSGVIGGIDSLEVQPFDNRIRTSNEFSRRIARNQQIILEEEAHLSKVTDPAGGCYYVEKLTAQIAELAWTKVQGIEEKGGFFQAVKDGFVQSEIIRIAEERKLNADRRKDIYVGVNMFANPIEQSLEDMEDCCQCDIMSHYEKAIAAEDANRPGLDKAISALEENSQSNQTVDFVAEAILAGATLEEAFDSILPEVSDLKCPVLYMTDVTSNLEGLRKHVTDYQQENETILSVFLANMGPVAQHKARADFSMGFLQVGGFYVANNDGFKTVAEAVESALLSKSGAVCICSTDDTYPELVPELISKLKAKKPDMIILLAGYPQDMVETYKEQGVDIFIHIRANAFETLTELANRMGVK